MITLALIFAGLIVRGMWYQRRHVFFGRYHHL